MLWKNRNKKISVWLMVVSIVLLLAFAGSAMGNVEGWWNQDIGTPGGSATGQGETITVTGDGADIGGNADAFHFAYKILEGDGSIRVRVVDTGSGSDPWAKVGLMIRETVDPGSRHAMTVLTGGAGGGVAFQARQQPNDGSFSWHDDNRSPAVSAPVWIALGRQGDLLYGHFWNGNEWIQVGTTYITMNDPVLIGLCVTSHTPSELRTGTFEGVSFTGNITDKQSGPKATNIYPSDGATDILLDVDLIWSPGDGAILHEVYFGTDANAVANATVASFEYKGPMDIGQESYYPGKLALNTEYFWRIDEMDINTTVHKGDVWSFTTVESPIRPLGIDDFSTDAGPFSILAPEDTNFPIQEYFIVNGTGLDNEVDISIRMDNGMPGNSMSAEIMNGLLHMNVDEGANGKFFISHDGNDADARLLHMGLNSFDITNGGTQDGIEIGITQSSTHFHASIYLLSNLNDYSVMTKTVQESNEPFVKSFSFSDLTPNPDGGPADLNNIGAIFFTIGSYGGVLGPAYIVIDFSRMMLDTTSDTKADGNLNSSGDDGDPVNTFTGGLFNSFPADLNLQGPMPLFFSRYCDSFINSDGKITSSLGDNWLGNFDMILYKNESAVEIITNRGRRIRFERNDFSWDLIGKTDIPYQLVQSETDFILGDPYTGKMHTFDSTGKLTKIEDGKGNVHTLVYSEDILSSVSDGLGRTLNFTYTGDKLSSVDDGTRTITFDHTGNDLTGYNDSMGNPTRYTYATGGLMTAAIQPTGNTHYSQTYNGEERVASQTDALGNTHTFTYNSSDTVKEDPLSNTRIHTHSTNGELTNHQGEDGLNVSMGYDSDGRRITITDRLGDTTTCTYHPESGKVASVTNADGTTVAYDYTARTNSSGIVFYDLTGITYPDSTTESFEYDSFGNITSYIDQADNVWSFTYNSNGQLLTSTNPAGGVTNKTYNNDGTLASNTDPAGNTTTFGYDSLKRLNLITHADSTTVVYTYDDNDNILTITDERGNTTTFTYNDNNNLATLTDHLDNTTTFAYDGMDRVVSVTDPLENSTTRTYDQMERLKTTTDRNGNTTTFGYDARGRLISITDGGGNVWSRTHDVESIIASTTNPLSNTTTFGSDKMGRITSTTSPLSSVTSVTYDTMGRMTAVQNPLGQTTTRTYDARGLTSDITLPDGAAASYARDDLGRITGITDPAGNNWQRAYDSHGRLTSTADPLGNVTTYQYDNRNRVSMVNLPASTLDLSYDSVGNIIRRLYSDGTDLDYTFDAMNRLTGAEGITLGYDANGRITSSNGLTITRDAGGRIATITMAPGKTITYTYDSRNRLTQVVDWLDGTTTFAYDDAGRLTSIARPNGVTTTYTYDNDGRLTGIAEGVISNIALTRDGKGQITAATRNLPLSASQVSTYTYDSAGRLTSDGTRTYTWDLASRMTSCTEGADTVTFTYDAASQLSTYTYDSMGRRTSDNTRTYTWDLSSRLTSCTEGPDTTTFTYDALGHRVSRTEGGTTRGYVWNYALGLPCISVTREGGNDLRYYIYTPSGSLLYSVEATDNSRHDYHYDEMGNTLFLTDSTGSVIGTYSYSPFGRLISSSGDLDNPFTWQGQYGIMDEGNDFYYIRARYYDANTARFVSRDPIKAIGPREIDPYQYAWNNPLKFKDVTGLEVNYFAISRKYGCGPSGTFTHFPVFFAHIFDPTMDKISGYDFILGPEEPWMFIKMYRTLSFLESSFLDVDRRFEEIEDRANKIEDRIRRLKDVTFSKREANEKYLKDILKKAIEKVAESRDALVNGPITRGEHEVLLKRLNEAIAEMEKAEEAYEHAGGNALLEIELNKIVVLL